MITGVLPVVDGVTNPKTSISLAVPNAWSSSGRGRLSFDDWDFELPDAGARARSESGAHVHVGESPGALLATGTGSCVSLSRGQNR
jgi:hypothetical protein